MGTVHLSMMELDRYGQLIAQPLFPVSAPNDKRIVEDSTVHAHRTVDLRIDDGGSADNHAVL